VKKLMFLIVIALAVLASASTYKSLTSKDKKDFENAYKAVKSSFLDKNYEQIIKFTPEILSTYESVMFDPDCKRLRPYFEEIRQILIYVRNSKKIDSIENAGTSYLANKENKKAVVLYDDALEFLYAADSANYPKYKARYDSLIIEISKDKTMATYSLISSLKYVDREFLKSYRNGIHDQFETKIAELSASLNPDSIKAFETAYPGIRSDDVDALLERARIASRHSMLRQPSVAGYVHYKALFGDDKLLHQSMKQKAFKLALYPNADPNPLKDYIKLFPDEEQIVWTNFEDSLYSVWNRTHNPIKAQEYMRFYPQGRYAGQIAPQMAIMPQNSFPEMTPR